jgi:hypothetical protein
MRPRNALNRTATSSEVLVLSHSRSLTTVATPARIVTSVIPARHGPARTPRADSARTRRSRRGSPERRPDVTHRGEPPRSDDPRVPPTLKSAKLQLPGVCVKNVGVIGFCLVERLCWLRTTQPDGKVAGRHGHHHGRDARNTEVRAVTSLDVRLSVRRRSPSDAAHATRRTPPEQPIRTMILIGLQICRTPRRSRYCRILSEPCDRLTARVNSVWRTGVVQWEKRVPSGMRYVSRAGDVITWSLEMPVNDDGLFGLLCPYGADHRFGMKVQSSRDSSGSGESDGAGEASSLFCPYCGYRGHQSWSRACSRTSVRAG